MKTYERTFVNPLLAMAFIEGINFVNDADLKCQKPVRTDDNGWKVIVEDHEPETDEPVVRVDTADGGGEVAQTEIVLAPVKVDEEIELDEVVEDVELARIIDRNIESAPYYGGYPCGRCIPCGSGGDCIEEINAACRANHYRPER